MYPLPKEPRSLAVTLSLALGVGGLCIALACWLPMLVNQARLWGLKREVRAARHPAGARVLGVSASYGLMGNGNHCDFVVDLTMDAPLSPAAVVRAYERVSVPFDGEALHLLVQGQPTVHAGRTRYTVGVFTQREAGFDINCH